MEAMLGKPVAINIIEVKSPDLNAQLVAENIAQQLEKRIGFRRAMKQAMQRATRLGAKASSVPAPAVWAALKLPAASIITRALSPCRPCAPISTMVLPRQTPPMARSASRFGSTRVKF